MITSYRPARPATTENKPLPALTYRTASQNPVNTLLLAPEIGIATTYGGSPLQFTAGQSNVVACTGDEWGATSFLAVNLVGAQAQGC